jgi:hypothetical protein
MGLRADREILLKASHMVDGLDSSLPGNNARTLRRGWARPGGDNAPRVAIPWPQDYVLGNGKQKRLCYDELNVYEWTQGCLTIIEHEEDEMTRCSMMALLRSTLRDVQLHGFESARFSYAAVLSLMEDGLLHWHDTARSAEERRSALVSRGVSSNTSNSSYQQFATMSCARRGGGGG